MATEPLANDERDEVGERSGADGSSRLGTNRCFAGFAAKTGTVAMNDHERLCRLQPLGERDTMRLTFTLSDRRDGFRTAACQRFHHWKPRLKNP